MDANQILNEMSSSNFLKGKDIGEGKQLKVMINRVELNEQERDGKKSKQFVLGFNGSDKVLGLNVGNTEIVIANLGGETDNWVGKELILYVEKTQTPDGQPALGVRVRKEYSDADVQTLSDAPESPVNDEEVDLDSIPSDI